MYYVDRYASMFQCDIIYFIDYLYQQLKKKKQQ